MRRVNPAQFSCKHLFCVTTLTISHFVPQQTFLCLFSHCRQALKAEHMWKAKAAIVVLDVFFIFLVV